MESSAPLPEQSSQLSDRVFIPELVGGSDPPGAGGVMLLTKEQYGHDPGTKWQDEVNRLGYANQDTVQCVCNVLGWALVSQDSSRVSSVRIPSASITER